MSSPPPQYQRTDLLSTAVDRSTGRIDVNRHTYQPLEGDEDFEMQTDGE